MQVDMSTTTSFTKEQSCVKIETEFEYMFRNYGSLFIKMSHKIAK